MTLISEAAKDQNNRKKNRNGIWIVLGVVYSVTCVALGLSEINAEGTGSGIFVGPALAWPIIVAAMFVLVRDTSDLNKILFVLLLLAHYAVVGLSVGNTYSDYQSIRRLHHSWYVNGSLIISLIALYISGQVVMWVIFFNAIRKTK